MENLVRRGTATVSKNDQESGYTLTVPPFDRVLVDSECSTDGAIRHHMERLQSAPSSRSPVWDDKNMDELVDLQKRLVRSGFRHLKSGGVLVYSTCSLSSKQNEQVISSLLNECDDSFLIPVSFSTPDASMQETPFIEEGSIPGTVRFNPIVDDANDVHDSVVCILPGSGFFLAKIGKS